MESDIVGTLRRRSDRFVGSIYSFSDVILQVGSIVYNPDLCREDSDLDYIVVCGEESIPHVLVNGHVFDEELAQEFFRQYKDLKRSERVDSVICKGDIDGTVASFNILTTDSFLHNCCLKIDSEDDLCVAWKFWNGYEKNRTTKITSFNGTIIEVPKLLRHINGYWLNRTPIGATVNGKYYVGYYQDQIMCGGQIQKCAQSFSGFYDALWDTMAKRLLRDFPEVSGFNSPGDVEKGGIGFHRSVCRHDKISGSLRSHLINKTLEGIRNNR